MKRPAAIENSGPAPKKQKGDALAAIKDKNKGGKQPPGGKNDDDAGEDDVNKKKTPGQQALQWAKKCDSKKSSPKERQSCLKGIGEAQSLTDAIKETISNLTAAHKDLQRLGTATDVCKKIIATKAKAAGKLCDKASLQLKQSRGYLARSKHVE